MERITVPAEGTNQIVKEYINVDCPVCGQHVIAWVEDGDSDVLDPCSHYLGFEWNTDSDEWEFHFEGKVPETTGGG